MAIINIDDSNRLIHKNIFDKCLIDNKNRKDISKIYPKREDGAYYIDKFIKYLKEFYNLNIQDYLLKYFNFHWPKCPLTNEDLGFRVRGVGIFISRFSRNAKFTKENNENFRKGCEKLSRDRMGEKNPMWGKRPWNKGLTPETDERIRLISEKQKGKFVGEETREKLRLARKIHPKKARHTTPHSKETIEKLRKNTARLWAEGRFNKRSSIEIKVKNFLNELQLEFQEEYQVVYYSMDFAFPDKKIAIECQGTYYHIDPRFYPDGPINAMQRRNYGRDKAKRKFCCDQLGWEIIELWETEINNGEFKEILLCKLRELKIIKK